MTLFSQRRGFISAQEVLQINSMNNALRNSIWNVLHRLLWSNPMYFYDQIPSIGFAHFCDELWRDFFKQPVDTMPPTNEQVLGHIRNHFFSCMWYEVYDFLEFAVSRMEHKASDLQESLNPIFERELSAYRFIGGVLTDIISEQEMSLLANELNDSDFPLVSEHLECALKLYSDRDNPDFRNSIKESFSALEAMARTIAKSPKATLPDALKALERDGRVHSALAGGFSKLYGYTSDDSGIRHAMTDAANVTADDARYFLLSCTSFINYLKARLASK